METSNHPIRLIVASPRNQICLRITYEDTEEREALKAERYHWMSATKQWVKAFKPAEGMSLDECLAIVRAHRDRLITERGYYCDDDWQTQALVSPENLRVATRDAQFIHAVSEEPDGTDGKGRTWHRLGTQDGYTLFSVESPHATHSQNESDMSTSEVK